MNFNRTTEYALQIMSLMARDEARLYRTDDIYDKLKIPYRYLRKLMTGLAKSGLSVTGPCFLTSARVVLTRTSRVLSLIEIHLSCIMHRCVSAQSPNPKKQVLEK